VLELSVSLRRPNDGRKRRSREPLRVPGGGGNDALAGSGEGRCMVALSRGGGVGVPFGVESKTVLMGLCC
jgi:hypothetical protein